MYVMEQKPFTVRFRVYLWIATACWAAAYHLCLSWDGVRDWSFHAVVTALAFFSGIFGARWAIEDFQYEQWKIYLDNEMWKRDRIIPKDEQKPIENNMGLDLYQFDVDTLELPDHRVRHWADSVLRMHKHGKVDLTEKKWSGNGKLFSQPAYRWMKYYMTESGVLQKGAWKTAAHTVQDITYFEDLKTGRKKIPPPPKNWH